MRANAKRGENELSDLIAREVTDSCDGVLLCNKVQLLPIHRLEGGGAPGGAHTSSLIVRNV